MGKNKIYSGWKKLPKGRASEKVTPGCLVIEGGAFRGLYNQGVLDAFMENDINMHTVIGVSAGALAGMNYVSGQIGRSARANLRYRHNSRYIGVQAFRRSRSILNLNFLLKSYNKKEPLNRDRLDADNRHFIAVATNCLTGETEYFDKDNCDDILEAVKASASMPYISPMVYVNGQPCLDGGCSCKIPYQWALDHDFEKIIVIRTREREYRKDAKLSAMGYRAYGKKFPAFAKKIAKSDFDYNMECDELDGLEKSGRIYIIAPSKPVTVGRLEKDMEKLGELYWLGYNDAMECMETIKKLLK